MKLINFYEVMNNKGDIAWGGASASEAVERMERGGRGGTCPSHR
jgi:hypothetical protein